MSFLPCSLALHLNIEGQQSLGMQKWMSGIRRSMGSEVEGLGIKC